MTPLRQRLIEDLQLRNRSPRTIETYVRHVKAFAEHFGRSPEQLGPDEVREYQLHLLQRNVSWSAFNQCLCALRFLYGTTLGRPETLERLSYGRLPKRIPRVLGREEVRELLACLPQRSAPRAADHDLCHRAADLGGRGLERRGHRQPRN